MSHSQVKKEPFSLSHMQMSSFNLILKILSQAVAYPPLSPVSLSVLPVPSGGRKMPYTWSPGVLFFFYILGLKKNFFRTLNGTSWSLHLWLSFISLGLSAGSSQLTIPQTLSKISQCSLTSPQCGSRGFSACVKPPWTCSFTFQEKEKFYHFWLSSLHLPATPGQQSWFSEGNYFP